VGGQGGVDGLRSGAARTCIRIPSRQERAFPEKAAEGAERLIAAV
jgi:hypothetical protein